MSGVVGKPPLVIPTPNAALVDENGQITVPWRAFFQLLAQRVGGVTGFTLPTTLDGAGQIVAGVSWTSGLGAPANVFLPDPLPTRGSIYSQTDGTIARTLYVAQGDGTWLPVAGV